jgi:hypothetical protein
MTTTERPWLEQIYQQRRQRTIELTRKAISYLQSQQTGISLSRIVAASRIVDVARKGVSSSGILTNEVAMQLYVESRDWRPLKSPFKRIKDAHPLALRQRPNNGKASVSSSLRRMTKAELVERVLQLEQALGEMREILVKQHALALAAHPSFR